MLSKEQIRFLKSKSNGLKATIIVGKEGIAHNLIENIKRDLEAHELVKIDILKTADVDLEALPLDLAGQTGSYLISKVGHTIVLFKDSKKHIYLGK